MNRSSQKENKRMAQKYNMMIFITFIVIILLIIIFLFLTSFVKPHVTNVEIIGNTTSADFINQRIKIFFNRPMNKQKVDNLVIINPSTPFSTTWIGNNLFIILNQNLLSDTQYTVTLSKNLKDLYNDNLNDNYIYTFKTKVAKIAYISRPFGTTNDTITESDYNFNNKKEFLNLNHITFYGINDSYIVAVHETNKLDDITILNQNTNEVKSLNLQNQTILSFDLSSTRNEFAYISQPVTIMDNFAVPNPNVDVNINIYNLDTNENRIFNPKKTATGASEVKYSPDGVTLIYKSPDGFYYLGNTTETDNYSPIGRYLSFGSFNKDLNKIILVNYDPLQTYSSEQFIVEFFSDRTSKKITDGTIPAYDPHFFNLSDNIVFSLKAQDLSDTRGIYKLVEADSSGKITDIYQTPDRSLELPQPSYDDRYILAERYNKFDLQPSDNDRSMGNQNKPAYANLIIYDLKNKNVIDNNIEGIDGQWLK